MDILSNAQVVEMINRVCALHDDAVVSAPLAAAYLGITNKKLTNLRQHGGGPPYIQYPEPGSKARNQKVLYRKGPLKVWRAAHEVGSTLEAASIRGMARMHAGVSVATESLGWSSEILEGFFLENEGALTIEQPFFVNDQGGNLDPYVYSHALACDAQDFEMTLENMCDDSECLVWMPWGVALMLPWGSEHEEIRDHFSEKYRMLAMRFLRERLCGS